MRRNLCQRNFVKQTADQFMGHRVSNGVEAKKLSGSGDNLMPAVQEPKLHCFEIMNMIRKGCARVFPIGSTSTEGVFNHPLTKVLMRDGGLI